MKIEVSMFSKKKRMRKVILMCISFLLILIAATYMIVEAVIRLIEYLGAFV